MPRNHLHGLTIDEISLVEEGGNQHARVVLMKSLTSAISGAVKVRAGLDPAMRPAFDDCMGGSSESLARLIEKDSPEVDGRLTLAVEALGEALAGIGETAVAKDAPGLIEATKADFAAEISKAEEDAPPFKHCADCPDKAACKGKEACAMEKKSPMSGKGKSTDQKDQPMKKASPATLAALAETHTAISKSATDAAALTDAAKRDELAGMLSTLTETVSEITADPDADEAAMPGLIRASLAEFNTAAAALLGDDVQKSRTEEPTMDPQATEIIKSLQTRLEAFETAEKHRAAVAKAHEWLGGTGPIEQVAAIIKAAPDDQQDMLKAAFLAIRAQAAEASGGVDIFKALGVPNPTSGEMGESEIVKTARRMAETDKTRRAPH